MRKGWRPSHLRNDIDHWLDYGSWSPPPCGHSHQQPFVVARNDAAMAVSFQGSAVAAGTATSTQATGWMTMVDRGRISVAYGQTSFTAVAMSSRDDTAFAAVDTNLQIVNADFMQTTTVRSSGQGVSHGRAWAQESVEVSFLALNIEGIDFTHTKTVDVSTTLCAPGVVPVGNSASFAVDVTTAGENTYADVSVENIAVEDQLSLIELAVTTAVDTSGIDPLPRIGSSRPDLVLACTGDQLILTGSASDVVFTASGDDLVFTGKGADLVRAGSGDNTIVTGAGNDFVFTLAGDDWIFAGDGNDFIEAGNGSNVVDGGHGNDRIACGDGNDVVRDGRGHDTTDLGGGTNAALLGGRGGDGNDHYRGGSGIDLFVIQGEFDRDTISGFSVAQGDRLILETESWSNDNDLRRLNGTDLLLQRSSDDPRDLVVTFKQGSDVSVLTLDDFFRLNPEYSAPQHGKLTDQQALPLLHGLLGTADLLDELQPQLQFLMLSGVLSEIG